MELKQKQQMKRSSINAGHPTTSDLLSRLVLTDEEVAELLAVTTCTVQNLHRTGQLPGVKVGKHLRWTPLAVKDFVEQLVTNN